MRAVLVGALMMTSICLTRTLLVGPGALAFVWAPWLLVPYVAWRERRRRPPPEVGR
jgi:hypothetical protein